MKKYFHLNSSAVYNSSAKKQQSFENKSCISVILLFAFIFALCFRSTSIIYVNMTFSNHKVFNIVYR